MIAKAATYQDVLYVVAAFSWSFMSIKPSPEILFFNGSESFKKNLSRGGGGELLQMWEDTENFCKRGEEGYWKRGGGGIFRGGIAIPGIPENLNVSSTQNWSWRKEGSKGKEMHLKKIG